MKGTIVFPATLDTKGQESQYIKNLIEKNGYNVITIDVGNNVLLKVDKSAVLRDPSDIEQSQKR